VTIAAPAALLAFVGVAYATMPRATMELRPASDALGDRATVQRVAVHRNCRSEGGRRGCGTERGSYPLTTRFGFATGGNPNIAPRHPVYRPGSLWTPTPTIYPWTTRFGFATGGNPHTGLHPTPLLPSSGTTGSDVFGHGINLRSQFPDTIGGHLRSLGGSRPMGSGGGLSGGSHGGSGLH
jgi:hypothetical protein